MKKLSIVLILFFFFNRHLQASEFLARKNFQARLEPVVGVISSAGQSPEAFLNFGMSCLKKVSPQFICTMWG